MTAYYPRHNTYHGDWDGYNSPYIFNGYEGPLSIPPGQGRSSTPQLYSNGLRNLSRRTEKNIAWFSHSMSRVDPCYMYSTEHWHYGSDREQERKRTQELHASEKEAKSLFSQKTDGITKDGVEDICYLCSTLEEHQKHLAKRGLQLKPKPRRKSRIQYVAPPPIVKAKKKEAEEEKQEVLYKIIVKTGIKHNAGTSANVFVRLIGTDGRMKKRQLKKNFGSLGFHFGQGTSERFFIKGPDIGRLQWLTIQHDGQDKKDSWYLDSVEVTNMATEETVCFGCRIWLSLRMAGYTNKIDLQAEEKPEELDEYRVTVATGKKMFAGTDARVFITLYGNKGVSSKTRLNIKNQDLFEKGAVDQFSFVDISVGKISKIRMEHDNSGQGPGWYLECVEVESLQTGRNYKFPCGQWLATDEGDGNTYKYLHPIGAKSSSKKKAGKSDDNRGNLLDYQVTVVTGTCYGAGTDAKVYINMYGSGGRSTGDVELDDEKDNFEKGQIDEFRIKAADVGRIKKIRIRHDNTSLAAGWFLDSITLHKYFSKAAIAEMISAADENLEEKVLEKASELSGVHYKKKTPKMHHKKSKKYSKRGKRVDSETSDSDSDSDSDQKTRYSRRKSRYQSDDSSDDEKQRKRHHRKKKKGSYGKYEEDVTDSETESDSDNYKSYKKSKLKHKKYRDGSSDENERSGRRRHRQSDTETDDDSDEKTKIKDGKIPFYEEYVFSCKKWLAKDEDDGKIERELVPKKVTMIYKV